MSVDRRALRDAFGAFLTGVTVVTTRSRSNVLLGFTANSFSSLSLDPPLLLVCPSRSLSSFAEFAAADTFAINILAEGQEQVSNRFAGFQGDRFADLDWTPDAWGTPLIDGAAATFSCARHDCIDAGDHAILIGAVDAFTHSGAAGLGYGGGKYFSLGLEHQMAKPTADNRPAFAGALIEYDNQLLLQPTDRGYQLPLVALDTPAGVRETVESAYAAAGVACQLGNVYSIYDDKAENRHYSFYLASGQSKDSGSLGEFVPVADIAALSFTSSSLTVMLNRFAIEHANQAFGLYLGDDQAGDVHPI